MIKKIKILLIIMLLTNNIFADNEILSLICVKNIVTQPGETTGLLNLESFSNVLKDVNKNELEQVPVNPKKVKSALDDFLDPKIFRIEYGTDFKARNDLRKNYNLFIEKIEKVTQNNSNPKEKEFLEKLRKLRIFSYQILTRNNNSLLNTSKKIPFGIEEYEETTAQLLNAKPFLYGKTLELLQFSGGHGNFYEELPAAFAGFQLTEFMQLCILLNNDLRKKICAPDQSTLNAFKISCSKINATTDKAWKDQRFSYAIDELGRDAKLDVILKSLGGIPQQDFKNIRDNIETFKKDAADNLNIKANTIYLNAAWSAGVIPLLEPILQNRGFIIAVISAPNDNDSSTDITDKLYSAKTITSNDIIKSFFDWYKKSSMEVPNTNNGFFPYVILKKKEGRLFLHYFLDPEINDFVLGFDKRKETKTENVVPKSSFTGLQNFNETYNQEKNVLVERAYIWHCCWHAPITSEVIKQATDEALKLKSLLTFLQKSNIYLKQHNSFNEFKTAALNLFEVD